MPPLEATCRHQKAVLWPFTGYDDQGEPEVGEPEELDVRWIESRKDMAGPGGTAITTEAQVIVAPDKMIPIHSHMWLGELSEWYGTGSAGQDIGLMEVVSRGAVPDEKGRVMRRSVGLNRLHDK